MRRSTTRSRSRPASGPRIAPAQNGYNTGQRADGDAAGNYTNSFGGTSSACPGAAGVAALVLSVNPALKWDEVKDLLRRACDRIDPQGGDYDASGHSPKYGYGRLNARTAVELAKPEPQSTITVSRTFDAPIPDLQTVSFTLDVADNDGGRVAGGRGRSEAHVHRRPGHHLAAASRNRS